MRDFIISPTCTYLMAALLVFCFPISMTFAIARGSLFDFAVCGVWLLNLYFCASALGYLWGDKPCYHPYVQDDLDKTLARMLEALRKAKL